eukprot:COSAG01_NODE_2592_length_7414_cov_6.421787_5_plen_164_part_00
MTGVSTAGTGAAACNPLGCAALPPCGIEVCSQGRGASTRTAVAVTTGRPAIATADGGNAVAAGTDGTASTGGCVWRSFMCLVRFQVLAAAKPQPGCGHTKGFSPVCVRRCVCRCVGSADANLQPGQSHVNGFSPVCLLLQGQTVSAKQTAIHLQQVEWESWHR